MRKILTAGFLVALFVTAATKSTAFAATSSAKSDPKFEISGGSSAVLAYIASASAVVFYANGGGAYTVMPGLQVGGNLVLASANVGGVGGTLVALLAGVNVNIPFDMSLENSFYVSPRLGFGAAGGASVAYALSAGKRFKIVESVAYTPSLGIVGVGASVLPNLTPVSFSFFF